MDDINGNDYYSKELEVLSKAYFDTSQKTTSFFQFALLLFSAPFAILSFQDFNTILVASILTVIGFVGVLIVAYLSDLRFESLLYARQVNKIRNLFSTQQVSKFDKLEQRRDYFIRKTVLIGQYGKPNYYDTNQFIYIVGALSLLNSFYIGMGVRGLVLNFSSLYLKMDLKNWGGYLIVIIITLLSVLVNFLLYWAKAWRYELDLPMYNAIIGCDIDGVIANHVPQFVKYCNQINKTDLGIDDITTNPVSRSGIIPVELEQKVFHYPEYWTTMPIMPDCERELSDLRNKLGYEIHLFTWRDWKIDNFDLEEETSSLSKLNLRI